MISIGVLRFQPDSFYKKGKNLSNLYIYFEKSWWFEDNTESEATKGDKEADKEDDTVVDAAKPLDDFFTSNKTENAKNRVDTFLL